MTALRAWWLLSRIAGPGSGWWPWLTAYMLVVLALMALSQAQASDLGRIQGIVRQEGRSIADQRLMLIRFGPDQEVQRIPGQTDAAGRFTFDGLETGTAFRYVVGVRYDEQLYRSDPIVLAPGQRREDVVVEVGMAGTKAVETPADGPSQVHIAHHIMAVVRREHAIDVREIVTLRNPDATPYRGTAAQAEQGAAVLHLPLPAGYENLRDIQGWGSDQVRSDAAGLHYMVAMPPGTHRVIYSYALPLTQDVRTLLINRTLPTEAFDIFVDTRQLVATSDLDYQGLMPIESHTFFHFRGTRLAPHTRAWLQLTRLRPVAASFLRIGSYGAIIGLALLGVLIPVYGLRRARTRAGSGATAMPTQIRQWQSERFRLLQTIAQLDDAWAAGKLDEAVYRQQRRDYKAQVLDLAQHLHRARNAPETGLIAAQREPE